MNVCLSVGWSVCLLVMCEGECKGRPASCESIKSFVIRHRRDGGSWLMYSFEAGSGSDG